MQVSRCGVVEGSGQKLEELSFQSLLQIGGAKVHCKLQSKVNIQHKNFPRGQYDANTKAKLNIWIFIF